MRALKKEQKAYLFDWSLVADEAGRFENLMAGHLLKWVQFQQDVKGERYGLYYFRDVEKREVDFVVTLNSKPVKAIECKLSDSAIDPSLMYFKKKFPDVEAVQVCLNPKSEYRNAAGICVVSALSFLRGLI